MGKLIVIEGLDGSGKSTQYELLAARLEAEGYDFRKVSFPDYESDSSALVKMYLAGRFGDKPGDVNCYAASLFYAVDRYASYKANWGGYYEAGGNILAARYATSNAVHQLPKLPREQWDEYLEWLTNTEYEKMGIPAPDMCIMLDVPPEVSARMMTERYSGDENLKDIHERDREYQQRCREAATWAAQKWGWKVIDCTKDGQMLSREEIAEKIFEEVGKIFSK